MNRRTFFAGVAALLGVGSLRAPVRMEMTLNDATLLDLLRRAAAKARLREMRHVHSTFIIPPGWEKVGVNHAKRH